MAATLLFLGRLEDLAGGPILAVSPGALETILGALEPALAVALLDERVRLALNGTLVSERGGIVLADHDECAFLPPVSGG